MRDLRAHKIKAYTKATLQHTTGIISVETDPVGFPTSNLGWLQATVSYSRPNLRKSLCQIINTIVPYCILWALMILTLQWGYPYWLTLVFAIVAGGILVRVFALFHDCCHGSFFASRSANTILG